MNKVFDLQILNNLNLLIYNIFLLFIANLSMVFVLSLVFVDQKKLNIDNTIQEYEEVDISYVCKLTDCAYIQYRDVLYKTDSKGDLAEYKGDMYPLFYFSEHGYVTNKLNMGINLKNSQDLIIVMDSFKLFEPIRKQLYLIIMIFVFLNIGLMISNLIHHKKDIFIISTKTKSEAFSNNIIVLTENIHHEFNTPMIVISRKMNKLEIMFDDFIRNSESARFIDKTQIIDSKKDFKLVRSSIEQISDILQKMKKFKGYKKESEHSIYDIIETTANVLLCTQTDKLDFTISEELKSFKNKKLSNGELTSILLNMIKNSMDANSNMINFSYENGSIFVSDEGNGIDPSIANKIFEEDFSTKPLSENINRGNGLTISKLILNNSGGSIKLRETSINGTIFELNIPMEKI